MTTKTVVALGSVGAFIVVMVLLVAYGGYRTSSDWLETYVSPAGSIVSPQLKEDLRVIPKPKQKSDKEVFRSMFIDGCMGGTSTYAQCSCSYDYLYDNYGSEAMMRIGTESYNGNVSDESMRIVMEAVSVCLNAK